MATTVLVKSTVRSRSTIKVSGYTNFSLHPRLDIGIWIISNKPFTSTLLMKDEKENLSVRAYLNVYKNF